MGTDGEHYADGVGACKNCGSVNILVRRTKELHIDRQVEVVFGDEELITLTHEYEEDTDEEVLCENCEEELG